MEAMPDKPAKRRWTRTEKWLLAAPLLVLACFFGMTTGKEIARRRMGLPSRVIPIAGTGWLKLWAVSKQNQILVSRSTPLVYDIYDLESGKFLQNAPFRGGYATFGPNGKSLIFNSPPKASVWDLSTGTQHKTLPIFGTRNALSPNGKFLATDYGIYNFETARLIRQLLLLNRREFSDVTPAFSQDGKLLATRGPYDGHKKSGDILIWDTATWKLKQTLKVSDAHDLAFSPDGKRIFCQERRPYHKNYQDGMMVITACAFDLSTGKALWSVPGAGEMAVSLDGRWIALPQPSFQVHLLDAATGHLIATLNKQPNPPPGGRSTNGVAFTHDGKQLLVCYDDGIGIWNMDEVNAQFAP